MGMEFTPEDRAPDEDFVEVDRQARLAACFLQGLKREGLCEYEACEVTKEWIGCTFTHHEGDA